MAAGTHSRHSWTKVAAGTVSRHLMCTSGPFPRQPAANQRNHQGRQPPEKPPEPSEPEQAPDQLAATLAQGWPMYIAPRCYRVETRPVRWIKLGGAATYMSPTYWWQVLMSATCVNATLSSIAHRKSRCASS